MQATTTRIFPRFIPVFAFNGKTFDVENPPAPVKAKEQSEKEEKQKNLPPAEPIVAHLPGIHVMPEPKAKAKVEEKKEEAPTAPTSVIKPTTESVTEKTVVAAADVKPIEPAPMANSLSAREGQFFLSQYETTRRLLPFNEDWMSGGDRFYNLVNSQGYKMLLKVGEVARTKDSQDRRVLVIGTEAGPVVIYQRYAEGLNTIVYDAPTAFRNLNHFTSEYRLTIEELERFFAEVVQR